MTRGRKPKPTKLKKLQGNPGKRKLNDAEPQPPEDMPRPPVGITGEALAAWKALAEPMHQCGMLSKIDGPGLESYCRLYAHARECWRKVEKLGMTVKGRNGERPNPWIREAHRTEQLLTRIRSELGLNATSRSRITITPAKKEDDMEQYLKFPAGAVDAA